MLSCVKKFQTSIPSTGSDVLAQVREYLNLGTDEETDTFLTSLYQRAESMIETHTGHIFKPSSWSLEYRGAGTIMKIGVYPISAILTVTVDGTAITSADYEFRPTPGGYEIELVTAAEESVVVTLTAGYASPLVVPPVAEALILAVVADLYLHRENQSEVSLTENRTFKMALDSLTFYNAG